MTARLDLGGDVFETEDQRNWTDLSFKTYSTPLERPFPVEVKRGEVVHQGARLVASGNSDGSRAGPLHIGPVTLARRFNAVSTSESIGAEEEARRGVDPLLGTDFAAAWTLGSIDALSLEGVVSVCYFETRGPRGIADDQGTRNR